MLTLNWSEMKSISASGNNQGIIKPYSVLMEFFRKLSLPLPLADFLPFISFPSNWYWKDSLTLVCVGGLEGR